MAGAILPQGGEQDTFNALVFVTSQKKTQTKMGCFCTLVFLYVSYETGNVFNHEAMLMEYNKFLLQEFIRFSAICVL